MPWTSHLPGSSFFFFRILTVVFLCAAIPASAQSNERMDAFLAEDRASFGNAAYFVLAAAGMISEEESVEKAVGKLREQDWPVPEKPAGSSITLGEYCLLLMKALEIPGGIMYRIIPGPRYAAREMDYLEFIAGNSHPGRTISGEEALRMLSRVLDWKEERT
jgi:hypothetical protein